MSSLIDLYWAALTTGPMVVELSSGSPRRKRLRLVDEEGHHLLHLAFVHQHPGGGVAGLAGVEEAALDVPARGLLEVGVGQHDVGRLPAQFEADTLDGVRGGGTDQLAGAGGAGEGDHVDVRVAGQGVAHLAAGAVDQVEHPGGTSASCSTWARSAPLAAELRLGLATTVHPAASA